MKRASILIRDLDMRPLFVVDFYGLDRELTTVGPGMGGNIVAAALQRRGIDPHSVSFNVFDVALDGALTSPMWRL